MMAVLWLFIGLTAAEVHFYDGTQDLDEGNWFSMFYAPWCTHCFDIEPEFGRAGTMSRLDFILVDCEENKTYCKKRSVNRFPTFNYYEDGAIYPYEGGRTTREFLEFVAKAQGPALHELEDLESFQGYFEVSFTLLYNSEDLKQLFKKVAEESKHSHIQFAALKSPRAELKVTGKDFRENFSTTGLSLKEMREFVELHSLPAVASMEPTSLPKVTAYLRGKDLLVLVADLTDLEQAAVVNTFTSVALKLRRNKANVQACVLNHALQAEQVEIYEFQALPAVLRTRIPSDPPQAAIHAGNLTREIIEDVALHQPMLEVNPSFKYNLMKTLGYVFSWQFVQHYSGWIFILALVLTVCLMVGYMGGEEAQKEDEAKEGDVAKKEDDAKKND